MKRERKITPNFRDGYSFAHLAGLQEHLFSPQGCPWDRAQSFKTVRKYLLEETRELYSAITNMLRAEREVRLFLNNHPGKKSAGGEIKKQRGFSGRLPQLSVRQTENKGIHPYDVRLRGTSVLRKWQRARDDLKEEIGDLLMQVLFQCKLAELMHYFTLREVMDGLYEKLVRRHPHVFGNIDAKTPGEVLVKWEDMKKLEKQEREANCKKKLGIGRAQKFS